MSLEAFGVKNLRCLTDTGLIPLKPITLLVGRNSSGKSTFLRAFPPLRQSVENARRSPILWQHKNYVDFGSIHDAINDHAAARSVTFTFSVKQPEISDATVGQPAVDCAVTLAEGPAGAHLRAYEIHVDASTARIELDWEGQVTAFASGGFDALAVLPNLALAGRAFLIPWIDTKGGWGAAYQPVVGPVPLRVAFQSGARDALVHGLAGELATLLHAGAPGADLERMAGELRVGAPGDVLTQIKEAGRRLGANGEIGALTPTSAPFQRILDRIMAAQTPNLLMDMDVEIADFMSRVAYLGPQRSVADRFYRTSDAAAEEVDPDSRNLSSFLASLSDPEWGSFRAFTRRYLGFEPTVRIEGLNVEILIDELNGDCPRNIADVGFGYAEVLPLCAMLWSSCVREPGPKRRRTSLVALEQPELHLHPAHQARLAPMIVGARTESRGGGARFMVETHSEALVNGLGRLIRSGQIKADDVQIIIFDQEAGSTSIQIASYHEDGALKDWPYGFLAPVAERLRDRFAAASRG